MGSLLNLLLQGVGRVAPHARTALGFSKGGTTGKNLWNIGLGSAYTGGASKYAMDKFKDSEDSRALDSWRQFRDAETKSQGRKGYTDFIGSMDSSVKDSVSKAASESASDVEDPFNYNQLFIASILKGLKQKPPTTHSGKGAGTYIPKPDLPKMSDYDTNKTYWNIG